GTLALGLLFERRHRGAAALGEGERRAGGSACGIEGRAHRRALAPQVLLGLPRGEARHPHRKAPRGRIARELAVAELRLLEARTQCREERPLERVQRARRQLLGADFEEEVVVLDLHAAPPAALGAAALMSGKPSASRLS